MLLYINPFMAKPKKKRYPQCTDLNLHCISSMKKLQFDFFYVERMENSGSRNKGWKNGENILQV